LSALYQYGIQPQTDPQNRRRHQAAPTGRSLIQGIKACTRATVRRWRAHIEAVATERSKKV
jgi:hypothetical protein